ncbi:YueI family protein [uncultured Limosilactobacillus sp.]|uniref:YueI family protein n=1 Tax=uncultured Limosilactobacillus sp. TaxID=2837629 RepID=UPI0025E7EC3E|nr:YueI family protein [uncultured Limosilactobacillus sp.]
MNADQSDMKQRIQNGIYGSPKIKPDEQRHYLGTFRERVWLTISVVEAKQHDWSTALQKELSLHPDSLVIINGNLDDSLTRNYLTVASSANVQFTVKTGTDIKTDDNALAVIVTDHRAVYQTPVDVAQKYDNLKIEQPNHQKPQQSFFRKLFHF